ncbi:MAG: GNAT family N-acetyltransferase [Suipraeoptans sp.]
MIRKINKNDRELYIALAKKFYNSDAVMHSVPESYFEATWNEMIRSNDYARGFILEDNGKTAGYALLSFTFSQEAGGKVAWIEEVFILPEFRGSGLGSQFFDYVHMEIEPEVRRVRLEVEPDNLRAIKLYEKLGFDGLPYTQMVKETIS